MPITIQPWDEPFMPVEVLGRSMSREGINAERFVKQVLLDQNFESEGSLLATSDDRPLGYLLAIARMSPLENAPDDRELGYITLFGVVPEARGQGVGSALLEKGESYLRQRSRKHISISSYAPGYFIPGADVNAYAEGLSFLTSRGYRDVYRPLAMEAPLWDLQVPDWIQDCEIQLSEHEGIRFFAYHPTFTIPLLKFTQRCFPGDWVRVVRSAMADTASGSQTRLHLAVLDNQVVGFSHHNLERFGPIGVDPEMRGKGIGQVLMYRTLRSQRECDCRTSWFLWSDDKTAARLYSHAGFREVRRFALLTKDP